MGRADWFDSLDPDAVVFVNRQYLLVRKRTPNRNPSKKTCSFASYFTSRGRLTRHKQVPFKDQGIEFTNEHPLSVVALQRLLLKNKSNILLVPHPSLANTYKRIAFVRHQITNNE